MPDQFLRQSALAHLALDSRESEAYEDAGVAMKEIAWRGIVNLRGKPDDETFLAKAEDALGVALPLEPNSVSSGSALSVLWLSPEEWWVVSEERDPAFAEELRAKLSGLHVSLVDVGESRTCIHVTGPAARDLLAKGTPLDLGSPAVSAGRCAGTHIAKAIVLLHQVAENDEDGPSYDLYVLRSFADYLWRWLEDAAGSLMNEAK